MHNLIENWQKVSKRIEDCYNSQSNLIQSNAYPNKLPSLLAVSKKNHASSILNLHQAGQMCFGENHLQEALPKIKILPNTIAWHFIGTVQSNKTHLIAENFQWVQSIDRIKIAERLSNQRPEAMHQLNVLIQINIDGETTKSGITSGEVKDFTKQLNELANIKCRGIMCIPTPTTNQQQTRASFIQMYEIWQDLQTEYPIDTLSMGMSSDLELAIECGSNMVRIGTDIFGNRT